MFCTTENEGGLVFCYTRHFSKKIATHLFSLIFLLLRFASVDPVYLLHVSQCVSTDTVLECFKFLDTFSLPSLVYASRSARTTLADKDLVWVSHLVMQNPGLR